MIFEKVDYTKDIFLLNPQVHLRTWDNYFRQYSNATRIFILLACKCHNRINSMFMPVLFVFRHCLELLIKTQLHSKNKEIPHNHNLYALIKNYVNNSDSLNAFYLDTEGDIFRYPIDNYGQIQGLPDGPFCTFCSVKSFIRIHNELTKQNNASLPTLPVNRFIKNEFAFYPRECRLMGVTATQYDEAISVLLKAVETQAVKIDSCYLPILFLIRHSLELKIKSSILSIGDRVPVNVKNRILKEHSVCKLYKILTDYTAEAIKKITDNNKFRKESEEYYEKALQFVETIKELDANSFAFRFPFSSRGNLVNFVPHETTLQDVIKLHQDADTFLTLGVGVLAENGYLELGDDILHQLFD